MTGTTYAANARIALVATCAALTLTAATWAPFASAEEPRATTRSEQNTYSSLRYAFETDDVATGESLLASLAQVWPDAELERASDWYSFDNLAAVEERVARGLPAGSGVVLVRLESDGGGILLMDMRFFANGAARVSDSGTADELRARFSEHFRQAGAHAVDDRHYEAQVEGDTTSTEPAAPTTSTAPTVLTELQNRPNDRVPDDSASYYSARPESSEVPESQAPVDYEYLSDASARPADWVPRRAGLRFAIGTIVDHTDHYQSLDPLFPQDEPGIYYPPARLSFGPSFERARFWERSVAMVYGGGATFSRGVKRNAFAIDGENYDVVMWRFAFYGQVAAMWSNATRRLRQNRFGISAGAGIVLQANLGDFVRARSNGENDDSISLSSTLYEERHFSADLQLVLRFDLPRTTGAGLAFDVRLAQSLRPLALRYAVNETRIETGIHFGF